MDHKNALPPIVSQASPDWLGSILLAAQLFIPTSLKMTMESSEFPVGQDHFANSAAQEVTCCALKSIQPVFLNLLLLLQFLQIFLVSTNRQNS